MDWSEIHRRLAESGLALQSAALPDAERTQRILRARARALAMEVEDRAVEPPMEMVVFKVAGESYGVESACVQKVYALKSLTPLPGAPAFVAGIVSLQGRIVSVVDIKQLFGIPATGFSDLNKVIVLADDSSAIGALADSVEGIRRVTLEEMRPAPPGPWRLRPECIRGVTDDGLVLLAGHTLLSDPTLLVEQTAESNLSSGGGHAVVS